MHILWRDLSPDLEWRIHSPLGGMLSRRCNVLPSSQPTERPRKHATRLPHPAKQVLALLAVALLALPAPAAESGQAQMKAIAPFLDPQTIGVARVDLKRVDVNALMDQAAKTTGLPEAILARPRKELSGVIDGLKRAGASSVYMVFSLADLPLQPAPIVVPLEATADAAAVIKLLRLGPDYHVARLHDAVVAGTPQALERMKAAHAVNFPGLADGFAAAGDVAMQVVLVVSPDTRRVIRETLPELPKELGGGSSEVLTQGIRWAALGVDFLPKTSVHLVIHSRTGKAAQALDHWLAARVQDLARIPQVAEYYPKMARLAAELKPHVEGNQLIWNIDDRVLSLLAPAAQRVREARARAQASNNLKQIGLAMHNYVDAHGHFPRYALMSKDGKPLLSWRVAILPYIEGEKLYKQFHLDEPWDSEHNKKLIKLMPMTYQSSSLLALQGKTTFLAVRGKHMMFPDDHGVAFREVTDGTSNTVAVVDASDQLGVAWTKPEDFHPTRKDPMKGLTGRYGHGFLAVFADCSVHFIPDKITPAVLFALFTRDGGEVNSQDY